MKLSLSLFLSIVSLKCFGQISPDIIWRTNVHSELVSSVAFSLHDTHLSSGSSDYHWNIWAVPVGDLVRSQFTLNVGYSSIAGSANGGYLVTGSGDGKTRMWRVSDGLRLWIGGPNNEFVYSVCFSPDDTLVATGRSDGINVRYAQTGGGMIFGEPEEGQVFDVCFSPDGTLLASANEDQNASLWSVPGGTLVRNFVGHSNSVQSVDFSPDGKLLATTSADGTARIWNVTNAEQLVVMGGGNGIGKFTADGKYLFTLSDGMFKVWRVSTGECVGSIANTSATTFDIAKNGKYFAYGTGAGDVVLARMPLVIDAIRHAGSEVTLAWQGGSGRYQVQARSSFAEPWQNIGGATTNTVFTHTCLSPMFYRVQSLPNP